MLVVVSETVGPFDDVISAPVFGLPDSEMFARAGQHSKDKATKKINKFGVGNSAYSRIFAQDVFFPSKVRPNERYDVNLSTGRPLPKLPSWMLPKVWGMPQELVNQYVEFDQDGCCVIGGDKCLQVFCILIDNCARCHLQRVKNAKETF